VTSSSSFKNPKSTIINRQSNPDRIPPLLQLSGFPLPAISENFRLPEMFGAFPTRRHLMAHSEILKLGPA
jgi:hypothetical protein